MNIARRTWRFQVTGVPRIAVVAEPSETDIERPSTRGGLLHRHGGLLGQDAGVSSGVEVWGSKMPRGVMRRSNGVEMLNLG
jgi:hypothetical protein